MTRKRVLVLGGGVTGLTVAHECREAGAEVILCEKEPHWGGKVLSYRLGAGSLAPGAPVEHSMRTYHSSYFSLFDTMRRIPRASGSVFDTLSSVAASTLIDGGRDGSGRSARIDFKSRLPSLAAIDRSLSRHAAFRRPLERHLRMVRHRGAVHRGGRGAPEARRGAAR